MSKKYSFPSYLKPSSFTSARSLSREKEQQLLQNALAQIEKGRDKDKNILGDAVTNFELSTRRSKDASNTNPEKNEQTEGNKLHIKPNNKKATVAKWQAQRYKAMLIRSQRKKDKSVQRNQKENITPPRKSKAISLLKEGGKSNPRSRKKNVLREGHTMRDDYTKPEQTPSREIEQQTINQRPTSSKKEDNDFSQLRKAPFTTKSHQISAAEIDTGNSIMNENIVTNEKSYINSKINTNRHCLKMNKPVPSSTSKETEVKEDGTSTYRKSNDKVSKIVQGGRHHIETQTLEQTTKSVSKETKENNPSQIRKILNPLETPQSMIDNLGNIENKIQTLAPESKTVISRRNNVTNTNEDSITFGMEEVNDKDYLKFLEELTNEVSSSHTEVSISFQKMMNFGTRNIQPKKNRRKVRLGPEAEGNLKIIYKTLTSQVSSSDFVPQSQIVSDKSLLRERLKREKGTLSKKSTEEISTSCNQGIQEADTNRKEEVNKIKRVFARKKKVQNKENSCDSTTNKLDQPIHLESNHAYKNEQKTERSTNLEPFLSKNVDISSNLHERFDCNKSKYFRSQNNTPNKKDSHHIVKQSLFRLPVSQFNITNEPNSDSKSKHFKSNPKTLENKISEKSSEVIVGDISPVSLRKFKPSSTSKREKMSPWKKIASPFKSPWNIKLRPTPIKKILECNTPNVKSQSNIGIGGTSSWNIELRSTPKKIKSNTLKVSPVDDTSPWKIELKPTPKKTKCLSLNKVFTAFDTSPRKVTPKNIANNITVSFVKGDIIDLKNLPIKSFPSKSETQLAELANTKDNARQIVLMSKNIVLIASSHLSLTAHNVKHEDKVTVEWCKDRGQVQSLTLIENGTSSVISMCDGSSVPLSFKSAHDCISFTHVFYNINVPSVSTLNISCGSDQQVIISPKNKLQIPLTPTKRLNSDSIEKNYILANKRAKENPISNSGNSKNEETISPAKTKMVSSNDSMQQDEIIITKFQKMLKYNIPREAVEHKMINEKIERRLIDVVLEEKEPAKVVMSLTSAEEDIASRFRKMIKVSIPHEAVLQKMKIESIPQKIISAVFEGTDFGGTVQKDIDVAEKLKAVTNMSNEEKEVAAKYQKLLKIKMPPEAVRHKMISDNVSDKIIGLVFGCETSKVKGTNQRQGTQILTKEEESTVMKYKKMLKVGMPPEAVRHSMTKEKIDQHLVKRVFDNASSPSKPTPFLKKRKSKLLALHWTPLKSEELKNSINIFTKRQKRNTCASEKEELFALQKLFMKQPTKKVDRKTENSNSKKMAQILKIDRAQNVCICLNSFKDFSFAELAKIIDDIDADGKIQGERVQFMSELLPKDDEFRKIESYKGPDSRLAPAEKFFRQLITVKRAESKISVMKTLQLFHQNLKSAEQTFELLINVCDQVTKSKKLEIILEKVLVIGNTMNEGTCKGDAMGFKFDSLQKLTQTKSVDGKKTVLDYIVMTSIENNERSLLDLSSDIPDCQKASRIQIGDAINDTALLQKELKECKTELTKMKNDQARRPVTRSMANPEQSPEVDPRKALMALIANRNNSDKVNKNTSIQNPLFGAINKTKEGNNQSKAISLDLKKLSPGLIRLDKFINDTNIDIKRLGQIKQSAIQACKDLSVYCGESGGERGAKQIFGCLSEFIINLNIATKKYDKQIEIEKIKAKKERRKTSEDKGKETISRIKNERVVGGNTANNALVKESSSKSHTGKENIHTITHQLPHKKFASTLITDGKKTIISHEPLTGEFIKQKQVSSKDKNNSKKVCKRTESNLMNASTAISTNNQNIIETQPNGKCISTYTDARKSNTNCKDSYKQDQYNVKTLSFANPSKISPCKITICNSTNRHQIKKECSPQINSPGDLQEKGRPKMTKSSTDMIPSETLQYNSPTRYSVDNNCSEVTLLQTKISTSTDVLVNNETINKHIVTNEVNNSCANHEESGATSIVNACVSPIPSTSLCSKVTNNVKSDSSLTDKTIQFNSITNKNEPSPVDTKKGSSLTPSPLGTITTMKMSCLASGVIFDNETVICRK